MLFIPTILKFGDAELDAELDADRVLLFAKLSDTATGVFLTSGKHIELAEPYSVFRAKLYAAIAADDDGGEDDN